MHSKGTQYDSPLKNQIIGAKLAGKSKPQIAALFHVPYTSVSYIIHHWEKHGTTHYAPQSGRPPKATPRTCRLITRVAKKNRKFPHHEVAKLVTPSLHPTTIRRILAREGLYRRRARRVPFLNSDHRSIRLAWARPLQTWDHTQFSHIIWSDECYIHIGGSPGTIYVTRSPEEADIEETFAPHFQKSPLKVMVWACAMLNCKGPLVVLDYPGGLGGGMTSDRYQEQVLAGPLLDFYVQKSIELDRVWFQQDNARCHTSHSTTEWFARNRVSIFPHPPTSPDLNPMENLWAEFKRNIRRRDRTPTSLPELREAIKQEWAALPIADMNKYIGTMPARVSAVIDAHGGNTKF
jgi:transposase